MRLLLDLILSVLILCTQQGAALHALSHLDGRQQSSQHDKQLPFGQVCAKCAAYLGVGSALSVQHFVFDPPTADRWVASQLSVLAPRLTSRHYAARAPPFLA